MIDLLTLVRASLNDDEVAQIVEVNYLQMNTLSGAIYYDNLAIKNFKQSAGVYIQIDTSNNLKIEFSLHKYWSEAIQKKSRTNSNTFSMADAKIAINHLLQHRLCNLPNVRVYHYEIGINLRVSSDCLAYMDLMKTVNNKPFYVNAKYKDERALTTLFHRSVRKHYKAYDKVFEMHDKKSKHVPDGNILRLESVNRRMDKQNTIDVFFSTKNLLRLAKGFYSDWRTLLFEQQLVTPKGTGRAKAQLCIDIMQHGKAEVINRARTNHAKGTLSAWEFRNIRQFAEHDFDVMKSSIYFIPSEEEKEVKSLLFDAIIELKKEHKLIGEK